MLLKIFDVIRFKRLSMKFLCRLEKHNHYRLIKMRLLVFKSISYNIHKLHEKFLKVRGYNFVNVMYFISTIQHTREATLKVI